MNKNVKEVLERASERYADDVIQRVESTAYLTPPLEREAWRILLADAYFTGAAELMDVIREANENKKDIRD